MPAMVVASILTSVPFALMHGEQTAYSLGPFLLLVCISLVLVLGPARYPLAGRQRHGARQL